MKKVGVALSVAVVAVGLYFWLGAVPSEQSQRVSNEQTSKAVATAGGQTNLAAPPNKAPPEQQKPQGASGGTSLLYAELRNTKDYGATLSRLLAMSGDPHAQYLATLVVGACGLVLPDYLDSFKKDLARRVTEQGPTSASLQERLALVDREAARCSSVNAKTLNELAANRFSIIVASAKAGDPYARSELLGLSIDISPEMRRSLVGELPALAGLRDPFILNNIGNFFSHFADRQFSFPTTGQVSGLEIATAFALLACDFGGDCGPTSPRLGNACIRMGRCGAASLEDYVQSYESTPARFAAMQALRATLRESAATGNWPAGLWPQI
jgi:hypothetical protein